MCVNVGWLKRSVRLYSVMNKFLVFTEIQCLKIWKPTVMHYRCKLQEHLIELNHLCFCLNNYKKRHKTYIAPQAAAAAALYVTDRAGE